MTIETWRPVVGHPGYEVSNLGRVLSHHRDDPRILRGTVVDGYRRVSLRNSAQRPVHQLVAEAFIGPRPDGLEVRHLDGVKTNCAVDNLTYGTRSANTLDKVQHGAHHNARKTHCTKRAPVRRREHVPARDLPLLPDLPPSSRPGLQAAPDPARGRYPRRRLNDERRRRPATPPIRPTRGVDHATE